MRTYFSDQKRDDGSGVTVEYAVESFGHPGNGWDDDGEGPVLYIERAFDDKGDVTLTDAEKDRMENTIAANLEPPDDEFDNEGCLDA